MLVWSKWSARALFQFYSVQPFISVLVVIFRGNKKLEGKLNILLQLILKYRQPPLFGVGSPAPNTILNNRCSLSSGSLCLQKLQGNTFLKCYYHKFHTGLNQLQGSKTKFNKGSPTLFFAIIQKSSPINVDSDRFRCDRKMRWPLSWERQECIPTDSKSCTLTTNGSDRETLLDSDTCSPRSQQ